MKLVQVDRNTIKKSNTNRQANLFDLVEGFIESGYDCAKIEGAPQHYKSPAVGAQVINISIKRQKRGGIRAITRSGEVYLIKDGERLKNGD